MSDNGKTPNDKGGAPGGPGDFEIDPHHPRRDLAMLARFPIRGDGRKIVADRVLQIAIDPEQSTRNQLAAAKVLAVFEKLNMEQERRDLGIPDEQINVTQSVIFHAADMRKVMQDDPGYIDYQRSRFGKGDADTGDLGGNGEQGPVADGPAPGDGGPGSNGNGRA